MEVQLQRITREIPHRSIAYLIIRRYPAEELGSLLAREVRSLEDQGARTIYVASTDPEAPLTEGMLGSVHLTHIHDMLDMERDLSPDRPRPQGRLRAEPLTAILGERWLALYHEAFAAVPNAATYGPEELAEQLARPGSCGLALEGERPVGIYELDLRTGEIAGIGLAEEVRGRGLGRELLLLAMNLLADQGCVRCWLQVSTANPAAYQLYQKTGFSTQQTRSRWFRAELARKKDRDAEEDGI